VKRDSGFRFRSALRIWFGRKERGGKALTLSLHLRAGGTLRRVQIWNLLISLIVPVLS
jgi:hypothetical protein